jgi:hypothetical protein
MPHYNTEHLKENSVLRVDQRREHPGNLNRSNKKVNFSDKSEWNPVRELDRRNSVEEFISQTITYKSNNANRHSIKPNHRSFHSLSVTKRPIDMHVMCQTGIKELSTTTCVKRKLFKSSSTVKLNKNKGMEMEKNKSCKPDNYLQNAFSPKYQNQNITKDLTLDQMKYNDHREVNNCSKDTNVSLFKSLYKGNVTNSHSEKQFSSDKNKATILEENRLFTKPLNSVKCKDKLFVKPFREKFTGIQTDSLKREKPITNYQVSSLALPSLVVNADKNSLESPLFEYRTPGRIRVDSGNRKNMPWIGNMNSNTK